MVVARWWHEDGCHGIGGGRQEWRTAGEDGGRLARREGRRRMAAARWRREADARELVEGDGSGGRHIRGKGIRRRGDSREARDVRADSIGRRADPPERRKKKRTKF
jgi:hypothetical protein